MICLLRQKRERERERKKGLRNSTKLTCMSNIWACLRLNHFKMRDFHSNTPPDMKFFQWGASQISQEMYIVVGMFNVGNSFETCHMHATMTTTTGIRIEK
jgi:hypothetical protein